jgi:hypothetical protein
MPTDEGLKMVATFHYVRDVFQNISWILLSCDPIMEDRGFRTDPKWVSAYPQNPKPLSPASKVEGILLHYFLVRQYFNLMNPLDLISIAAVPWDPRSNDFITPLCLASRMLVTDSKPWDLMWIGIIQVWDRVAPADGVVRQIGCNSPKWDPYMQKRFAELIPAQTVLSLAFPLLGIINTDHLEERLIRPLLSHPWPPDPSH